MAAIKGTIKGQVFSFLTLDPNRIEAIIGRLPPDTWVVLGEIQKVPALLDKVHRLIETRSWNMNRGTGFLFHGSHPYLVTSTNSHGEAVRLHCICTIARHKSSMAEPLQLARALSRPERSFFLFGPRGTGKSTWLRQVLPDAPRLDLLDASLFLELIRDPHRVEAIIGQHPPDTWVVLDEIQKVPALLDEVHRLIETRRWRFALCGSSARNLRRGGANLLAGRALTLAMEGFTAAELGDRFNLSAALEWGTLPFVALTEGEAPDILAAYVNTYLKEEIREEGVVRQVSPFIRFLGVAGQLNGQMVNGHNIAREAAVPRSTVDAYFSILTDTLIGQFLLPWRPGVKVREAAHPKFYWFDPGVARAAAGLLRDPAQRVWLGTALETLIFHELRVHNEISRQHRPLAYYRTAAGVEVDFIIETRKRQTGEVAHVVAIEVKLSEKWDAQWEKPLRELAAQPSLRVERAFGVYMGSRRYEYDDLTVLPVADFLKALRDGRVF